MFLESSLHGALNGELINANYTDLNMRLRVLLNNLKRKQLDITLNRMIRPVTPNQPFSVENGILRVSRQLVLCRISDKTLSLSRERNI